jgi:molybdenum cofactor biosynthesis enzyme MoaA
MPPFFHVTVLSNLARGYDKYVRAYDKARIPESTFPGEFYVLPKEELRIGAAKAARLRERLGLRGDALVALEADLPPEALRPNLRTGLGQVWPSPRLPLTGLHALGDDGALTAPLSFEDAVAASLSLNERSFAPFNALRPRSISLLPIARGCQAACPFCFSEASASAEQPSGALEVPRVSRWLAEAADRGARRAVITGGGEPTLVRWEALLALVRLCRARFETVVLISNGVALAHGPLSERLARLEALRAAGLTVLAISRHHPDEARNAALMRLDNATPTLAEAWRAAGTSLEGMRLRLVSVLQRGAVESADDVAAYVRWAAELGADEVCFKELYVSTSRESVFHSRDANTFSARQQVPLARVLEWARAANAPQVLALPWGAPVFATEAHGRPVRVAAYTEPSLFWERTHGLARSWNVMADGTCLASLEDRSSRLALPEA